MSTEHAREQPSALFVSLLVAAPLLSACGALKGDLEECQARLASLEGERSRLEQDLTDLRADYKDVLTGIGLTPPAEQSFSEEYLTDVEQHLQVVRSTMESEVPPLVREELEKQLQSLTALLDRQFGEIDTQYAAVSGRLVQVSEALEVANTRLEGIERTGSDIQEELAAQRIDVDVLEREVQALADSIGAFDESHFLCRECEDYLDLKRKRKRQDVILGFHADLRSALRRLPYAAARPASESGYLPLPDPTGDAVAATEEG